jgi:ankyrin repeat protein
MKKILLCALSVVIYNSSHLNAFDIYFNPSSTMSQSNSLALYNSIKTGNINDILNHLKHGISPDEDIFNISERIYEKLVHITSKYGHSEILNMLIEKGANIDAQDSRGNTPLHKATEKGHTHIVNILLKNKAHIDVQNNNGETALHFASVAYTENHRNIARILVDQGADIAMLNRYSITPLDTLATCITMEEDTYDNSLCSLFEYIITYTQVDHKKYVYALESIIKKLDSPLFSKLNSSIISHMKHISQTCKNIEKCCFEGKSIKDIVTNLNINIENNFYRCLVLRYKAHKKSIFSRYIHNSFVDISVQCNT